MVEKNYEVSEETRREVDAVIAEGQAKYASIAHIVMESDFDAGPFFDHEFEED